MTGKQAAMARAMAEGMGLEDAAKLAGYNLGYARKKAREPGFLALLERFKTKEATKEVRSAIETLWGIINGAESSPQERTQAIRTLIAYEKSQPVEKQHDINIVDDLPFGCKNCPYTDYNSPLTAIDDDPPPAEEARAGAEDAPTD